MEHHPRGLDREPRVGLPAVDRVPEEPVADRLEVDTDLVGAPRVQDAPNERGQCAEALDDGSTRCAPPGRRPAPPPPSCAADGCACRSPCGCSPPSSAGAPPTRARYSLVQGPGGELRGQAPVRRVGLGDRITPEVSRSSRWTIPGAPPRPCRSGCPGSAPAAAWTRVSAPVPAPGCTTMPAAC